MATYQTILVEQRGAVTLVTLNRPEALNALNATMLAEMIAAFAAAVEAQAPAPSDTAQAPSDTAAATPSQPATTDQAAAQATTGAETPAGLSPLVWIGGLIVVVAAILYWFVIA